jgi:hypothetical protein
VRGSGTCYFGVGDGLSSGTVECFLMIRQLGAVDPGQLRVLPSVLFAVLSASFASTTTLASASHPAREQPTGRSALTP